MKTNYSKTLFCLTFVLTMSKLNAQVDPPCDSIANACSKYITSQFISDGQMYRSLIYEDQSAEFKSTFFGGSTYRIAGCTGFEPGSLIFSVYDIEHNLLFSNSEHKNSPYWDFKIENTINCTVEARLDQTKQSSGCAVVLIGFAK